MEDSLAEYRAFFVCVCVCLQVSFSLKENSENGSIMKDFLYKQGGKIVREQLKIYVRDLKEGKYRVAELFFCGGGCLELVV